MKIRIELTQIALVAALIAAAGLLLLDLYSREIDAEGFRAFRQENLLWNATQLRFEMMRFVDALSELRHAHSETARASAQERFDILWSRAAIFEAGDVGARLREITGAEAVGVLNALLRAHEATIFSTSGVGDAALGQIADDFRRLLGPVQNYVATVSDFEEKRMTEVHQAIVESNRLGSWKAAASTLLALCLLLTARLQVKADRRKLEEQRRLTAAAEQGADAKKRFLTMMSHELRTPMNGVIGMLALLERSALDRNQRTLTTVAQRSAAEMLGLVEDILDLSDLQSGLRPPEPEVVSLAQLALDAAESVTRRLCRPDHGVTVVTKGPACQSIWVERELFAKALRQVAVFFVDRLHLRAVSVTLELREQTVFATIAANHDGPLPWQPEALLGPLTDADCVIQTEAIGPAVARGLLRQMQGGAELQAAPGRIAVVIHAPAPIIDDLLAPEEPAPAAPPLRAAG